MNDNIKLILFDIGGVQIEYSNVFKTVSKEQNFPQKLIDATFDKYDREITIGKITPQELYLTCINENNLMADTNYDFTDSWLRDFNIIKPTYELIPQLKQHYKIGLFSNFYKNMVPELIKRKLIQNINYDYILFTTGLKPSQIFFIDDRDDYLNTANKLDWNTFKFNTANPEESVNDLRKILLPNYF